MNRNAGDINAMRDIYGKYSFISREIQSFAQLSKQLETVLSDLRKRNELKGLHDTIIKLEKLQNDMKFHSEIPAAIPGIYSSKSFKLKFESILNELFTNLPV